MVRGPGLPARGTGVVWRLAATLALLAALLVGALGKPGPAGAAGDRILVYSTESGYSYNTFAGAVGLPLDAQTTLPASLAPYACALLVIKIAPVDQALIGRMATYLAGGGRLVVVGENSFYPAENANLNALLARLGAPLAIDSQLIGSGASITSNIDAAPLATGVTSLAYASTSRVTVGAGGQSLARTVQTSETYLAAASLGGGLLVVSGDSGMFADQSAGVIGYTQADNGTFARNLCLGVQTSLTQVRGTATYGDTTGGVTARLAATGGSPIAGATVSFTVNGTPVGTAPTNAQGVAILNSVAFPAGLNAGTYQNVQVCATFAGDDTYPATGPTCGPLVVARRVLTVKPADRTVGLKQPNPPTTPPAGCVAQATVMTACWLELTNGSSFAPGDTWASLNLTNLRFQYSRNPASTNASEKIGSTYRITALGATSSNYELRYQPGTLTVK